MAICSECGKKIGFLEKRHNLNDGALLCSSCFERKKRQEKQTITEYVKKYVDGKETNFIVTIDEIIPYWIEKIREYDNKKNSLSEPLAIANIQFNGLIGKPIYGIISDEHDEYLEKIMGHELNLPKSRESPLDFVKGVYRGELEQLESFRKKDRLEISMEERTSFIHICKIYLEFIEDIEKLNKLFQKKGIERDYETILSLVLIFTRITAKGESDKDRNKFIDSLYQSFVNEFGINVSKELVITEYFKKRYPDEAEFKNLDNEFDYKTIVTFLKKFNLELKDDELKNIINSSIKKLSMENLEKDLFSPKSKQMNKIEDYRNLNGYEFEEYLKNLFIKLGYTVMHTPKSGDQGADLILSKNGEQTVVQAKKYSGNVSNKAIQEIVASKKYYGADKTMVVTTGYFTKNAVELAYANGVELWDRKKLDELIK